MTSISESFVSKLCKDIDELMSRGTPFLKRPLAGDWSIWGLTPST